MFEDCVEVEVGFPGRIVTMTLALEVDAKCIPLFFSSNKKLEGLIVQLTREESIPVAERKAC